MAEVKNKYQATYNRATDKLTVHYKGRTESVVVHLLLENLDSHIAGETLLKEEEVSNALEYLLHSINEKSK